MGMVAGAISKPAPSRAQIARWAGQALGFVLNRYLLYLISVAGFLYLWDAIALAQVFGTFMPRPIEVVQRLAVMMTDPLAGKTLMQHLWASLQRVLIGFAIGVVLGVPLGLFMALNRYVCAFVKPVFDLFKPMPPIAWISLSLLWFGIGEGSKVFIILIGAIVPCVINAYNGIRLVDPELYDAIRMLGANRRQEALEVTFPAAFPAIFAGIQISLSLAWSCVVAAEMVGARDGMGYLIIMGMNQSRPSQIIGGMVIIAVVAWLLAVTLGWLEKRVCPWKREIT
jgi:NitT/TauT family transport system permease protein/sulfonate transport system permease protein